MADFLFHRCELHHEEFQLYSSSNEFSDQWKRNPLCSIPTRSRNIFCSHGTALHQAIKEKEGIIPETQSELLRLQNRLFLLDHKKGELEKYVFEKEEATKIRMQDQLQNLIREYHLICDQIQAILTEMPAYKDSSLPVPKE